MFNVQHKENGDSFAARHVKALNVRSNLRDEASILWQLRNVPELIQLQGKIGCFVIVYYTFFPIYFFFFTTHVINYINLSCIFSGLYEGPQQSVLVLEDLIGKETCLLKNRNSSRKVLPRLIILLFFSFLK